MNTCFSIMPFDPSFNDIAEIIRAVASECGLKYVRGDRRNQPGSIMPQILNDIRRAAVVVADISGNNPNVFYELGIAHNIKGPECVVIIKQKNNDEKEAYDVHEYRQILYIHNNEGRAELRRKLPEFVKAAAMSNTNQEIWDVVIRGRIQRTKLIVRDLQRLVDNTGSRDLSNITIRISAGLGSLAISDREPSESLDKEYKDQLLLERNTLRKALSLGARLKAILNPPRRFAQAMLPIRLRTRYERLIGLLEGRSDITNSPDDEAEDVTAMKQCDFVLTPISMPNLFIIGDTVAYEGMKRKGAAGFDVTHCETSVDGLHEMISNFDKLYEDSRLEMIRIYPPDGRIVEQLKAFYHEAIGERL
jgi:hypothetical protein